MSSTDDEIFDPEQGADDLWPRLVNWFFPIFLWDGLLPMGILVIGYLVRFVLNGDLLGCYVFIAPLIGLLVRSHFASIQIEKVCGGRKPLHRQLLIVVAIIIMLVFEYFSLVVQMAGINALFPPLAPNERLQVLLAQIGIYFLYLFFIILALRPCRDD